MVSDGGEKVAGAMHASPLQGWWFRQQWIARIHARLAFRWLVIACQAFTIVVTWPLWQVRAMPPLLPAAPLPTFDMGALLLIALAVVLIRPGVGIGAYIGLLLYAMLTDQTRIQPQMVSMAFLMLGTLKERAPQSIARVYLVALWTWAGINKLLSPAFIASTGPGMARVLLGFLPGSILQYAGYAIGLGEFSLGMLTLIPRTRKAAAVWAFVLHIGILLTLIKMHWNSSVWAWNIALAFSGAALVWSWRESILRLVRENGWIVRLASVILLISPAGFYVGAVDAYLAHNLYSSNIADASAPVSPNITWQVLNVPLPPEHRLYEQFFQLTCHAGEQMNIRDPRPYFVANGWGWQIILCEAPK